MKVEFKIYNCEENESYLVSLHEIADELNCFIEKVETNKNVTIIILGSDIMINWLILRMHRYDYQRKKMCKNMNKKSKNNE